MVFVKVRRSGPLVAHCCPCCMLFVGLSLVLFVQYRYALALGIAVLV